MSSDTNAAQTAPRAHGRCLCGAVQYAVFGPLRPVVACHCNMCRRSSGHHVAATACRIEDFLLIEGGGLRWYHSSATARRGFCQTCGSNLFWEPESRTHISIMSGTLDQPTGLVTAVHIHICEAGDYYQICDDLPQRDDGEHGISLPFA